MVQLFERGSLPRVEIPRPVNTNCVIAALEDAFIAPATHEEKVLRESISNKKDEQLERFLHLANTPEGKLELYKANLILETRAITAFLKQLSTHQTPLGRAISRYDMRQKNVTTENLADIVYPEQITLVVRTEMGREWHMMHARKMPSGRIVSGNDRDQTLRLKSGEMHLAYIFTKK